MICFKDPASHPYISKEEREYLKAEMGQLKRHDDLPSTPWREILTSVPVLAYICAQVGFFAIFINSFRAYNEHIPFAGWSRLGFLYHGH